MADRSDESATEAAGDLAPALGNGSARPELPGAGQGWLAGFLKPVYYARSRDKYRPPPDLYRRLGRLGPAVTTLGLGPRDVITLEVPGRRSGVIRRTIMVRAACDGDHYLVALAGEAEWVRNVRAAGGRVVIGRRQRRAARLVEVPPQQRAPVIRAYLRRRGRRVGSKAMASEARNYFGVSADASLEEIQGVVEHYPVFRIDYQGHASTGRGWGSDSPRPNAQERASRAGHKLKAPRLDAAGLLKNFARSSDVITAHRGDRLQCRGNE